MKKRLGRFEPFRFVERGEALQASKINTVGPE
jgi:hypothetical protein